jgi:hypothetical protein
LFGACSAAHQLNAPLVVIVGGGEGVYSALQFACFVHVLLPVLFKRSERCGDGVNRFL